MRSRNFLTLFFIVWTTDSGSLNAKDVSSLADLQPHWDVFRREHAKLTTLEFTQDFSGEEKDGKKWTTTFKFAGKHTGKLFKNAGTRGSEPTNLFLANERYAAELRGETSGDKKTWSISSLNRFSMSRDSPFDKELLVHEESWWNMATGLRGMSADVGMLDARWCRIISIESDGGLIRVVYAKDPILLPDDAKNDPSLAPRDFAAHAKLILHPEGWFKFDPQYGYGIVEFEGRDSSKGIVNTERFSDYRRIDGKLWFPFQIDRESKQQAAESAGQRILTGKQTAIEVSTGKVNTKEFYLSFYGLPEPFEVAKTNYTVRIAVTLIIALVGIVLVVVAVSRRRKSAG